MTDEERYPQSPEPPQPKPDLEIECKPEPEEAAEERTALPPVDQTPIMPPVKPPKEE